MLLLHSIAVALVLSLTLVFFLVWLRGWLLQRSLIKCIKRKRPRLWQQLSRHRPYMQRTILVWRWLLRAGYSTDDEIVSLAIALRKKIKQLVILMLCFVLSLVLAGLILHQ